MKTIHARIIGDKCVVSPETPLPEGLELNEHPAYQNWDKLRRLGWINCRLLNEPRGEGVFWHYPENDLDRLELEIATYDYYYEMSDDGAVWSVGRYKDQKINHLIHICNKEKAKELWKAYVEKASSVFAEPEKFMKDYLERFNV